MAIKRTILDLGARERQVMEAVLRAGEGSVKEISAAITDSPGDVIVRATLGELVKKDLVQFWNVKNRYFYKPTQPLEKTRKAVLAEITKNLFGGNIGQTAIVLLENGKKSISEEELNRLAEIIEEAKNERKDKKIKKNGKIDIKKEYTKDPGLSERKNRRSMENKEPETEQMNP